MAGQALGVVPLPTHAGRRCACGATCREAVAVAAPAAAQLADALDAAAAHVDVFTVACGAVCAVALVVASFVCSCEGGRALDGCVFRVNKFG